VRRVLSVLEENPDLSNAELARVAGMSTNGFHRLFREQVGVTPHAYVVGKKMELACGLLQHTGDTMDAIAASCGFNDRAYFARAFRRHFRMSPGEYRRRHRG
jgi:AraC-like DNA-binding protein